jgi:hypothetical protein
MPLDVHKISVQLTQAPLAVSPAELRREEALFLVGAELAPQPTLETIFDSDCQKPVELFVFNFQRSEGLIQASSLLELIKKNLRGFVLARLDFAPAPELLEFAYAHGIDLVSVKVDSPLDDAAASADKWLPALEQARHIFPRWAVGADLDLSTLSPSQVIEAMKILAAGQIVPLVALDVNSQTRDTNRLQDIFTHLSRCWKGSGMTLRPWGPLIERTTPLVLPSPRTLVGNLLIRAQNAHLRTGSDLRRLLRVREVEKSFDSAGL